MLKAATKLWTAAMVWLALAWQQMRRQLEQELDQGEEASPLARFAQRL
jgi:hypothetical protein